MIRIRVDDSWRPDPDANPPCFRSEEPDVIPPKGHARAEQAIVPRTHQRYCPSASWRSELTELAELAELPTNATNRAHHTQCGMVLVLALTGWC